MQGRRRWEGKGEEGIGMEGSREEDPSAGGLWMEERKRERRRKREKLQRDAIMTRLLRGEKEKDGIWK